MKEKDETPEYEAESHSPSFLKKAEHLAKKKGPKAAKRAKKGNYNYKRHWSQVKTGERKK